MTSQQRADEWLAVWRELRTLGYSPEARDAVIRAAITDWHVARVGLVTGVLHENSRTV